jgi:hypothetical protein
MQLKIATHSNALGSFSILTFRMLKISLIDPLLFTSDLSAYIRN